MKRNNFNPSNVKSFLTRGFVACVIYRRGLHLLLSLADNLLGQSGHTRNQSFILLKAPSTGWYGLVDAITRSKNFSPTRSLNPRRSRVTALYLLNLCLLPRIYLLFLWSNITESKGFYAYYIIIYTLYNIYNNIFNSSFSNYYRTQIDIICYDVERCKQ